MQTRGSLLVLIVMSCALVAEGQVVASFFAGTTGYPLPTSEPGASFALDFGSPGQFPPDAPMETVMLQIGLQPGIFFNPGTPPIGDLVIELDGVSEEFHFPSTPNGWVSFYFYDPNIVPPPAGANGVIPQSWVDAMADGHLSGRFRVEDFNADGTTSNWGFSMMATALVPEPGSGLLAFFGLSGLVWLRRRRL